MLREPCLLSAWPIPGKGGCRGIATDHVTLGLGAYFLNTLTTKCEMGPLNLNTLSHIVKQKELRDCMLLLFLVARMQRCFNLGWTSLSWHLFSMLISTTPLAIYETRPYFLDNPPTLMKKVVARPCVFLFKLRDCGGARVGRGTHACDNTSTLNAIQVS